ncbi:MAG TPA: hypothetical protein VOA87_12345, partial [Thermoanaerobaculia bacterium]|nr:hypothetical protein [Thermoanaerobaculia bacterium]
MDRRRPDHEGERRGERRLSGRRRARNDADRHPGGVHLAVEADGVAGTQKNEDAAKNQSHRLPPRHLPLPSRHGSRRDKLCQDNVQRAEADEQVGKSALDVVEGEEGEESAGQEQAGGGGGVGERPGKEDGAT